MVIRQIWPQPALGFFDWDVLAGGVVGYLILREAAYSEVVWDWGCAK